MLGQSRPDALPAAPQWTIIDEITTGDAMLAVGSREGATAALLAGLRDPEGVHFRAPGVPGRSARSGWAVDSVVDAGRATIARLAACPAAETGPN